MYLGIRRLQGLHRVQWDIVNARGPNHVYQLLLLGLVCLFSAIAGKRSDDSSRLRSAWLKLQE